MDSSPAHLSIMNDTLAGGGEMGALIRSLDWSMTPLGPVESWPQSLRTSVSICLASHFPMLIWWGPELVMLYNDAYRPMLGTTKHPQSMGQRGRECWPEIWDIIGPMLEGVLRKGEATWSENQLLPLDRNGYVEECYFTFSYSPIRDETGGIGGVFTAVTETTRQVLGDRRLRTLHDLAERSAEARTAEEVCLIAAETLADNTADIPFALLYVLAQDGKTARLAGSSGLATGTTASPLVVEVAGTSAERFDAWPLEEVIGTGQGVRIDRLPACLNTLLQQNGDSMPCSALVLPISRPGQQNPYGILVAGISPLRILDDDYRSFFELVVGQVANAIAKARAYQEARERAEALAALDRAKTDFFSNVSHEFRTPLTLILGPVEDALVDTDHVLLPDQRERLEIVRRNSLRLLKLVNTLLDFSRVESERIQAFYEPTALATFTTELASTFRSAIEHAHLTFVVNCPPLTEPVYVDHDMWEKIVLNLLSNAFKFTFEGQITVSLQQNDSHAILKVSDTGIGIPAEELPNIFKRFHRVRGARVRTHEGSGIGLALVQDLIRLHGGTIHVTSVVGEGTTFTVSIPLGTAHLPAEHLEDTSGRSSTSLGATPFVEEAQRWLSTVPATASEKQTLAVALEGEDVSAANRILKEEQLTSRAYILLADDNADMRDYMQRLLSPYYTVEAVTNGAEALAAVAEHLPHLVLSDIMMPEIDGFQLLKALRKDAHTRGLPVILLSARTGEEAAVEGLEAGADDYMVKPFAARELLARVKTHLELARIRQEIAQHERLHTEHLQKLARAALVLNSMLSSQDILWIITDQARAIIGTHQAITTRTVNEQWVQSVNAVSLSDKYAAFREYDVPPDGSGIYSIVCSTNKPMRMAQEELEKHPAWRGFGKEAGKHPPLRGWLAAPLVGRNGTNLGVIQLSDKYKGEFTEEDEAILVQLAQMASIAIENADLYAQLQKAVRGRDELLSTVSHDLKNPLGTIKGYAQLLKRQVMRSNVANKEQLADGLSKIDTTVTKMTILINELLSLSRAQMGQQLDRQPTDLVALAQQVVKEQQQTTRRHQLHVETDLEELAGIWDAAHLERVIVNLVSNAIKYSPDGGEITIEIFQEDDAAGLVVRDSGLGIPAQDLPHIFEQFHRASNVTGKIKGTGIGLASVHQIVERHGGTINVTSEEGKGSTFAVKLPLTPEEE